MLKGHVFKRQIFGNQIFALFIDTFLNGKCGVSNKYGNAMKVTYSGSNVTISDGAACVRGRFLEEDSSTTISAGTGNSYCSLVIEIDLDKENTSSDFVQGAYKIVKGINNYPYLTQTDIVKNNSGIYQYELARFRTTASGITNFQDRRTFLDFDSIYELIEAECQSVLQEIKNEYEKTLEGSTYVLKKIELTNENLNDITEPGFYYGQGTNTVSSKPDGVSAFALLVMRSAGAFTTQILISSSTNLNNIYIRRLAGTSSEISSWEGLVRENYFEEKKYTKTNNGITAVFKRKGNVVKVDVSGTIREQIASVLMFTDLPDWAKTNIEEEGVITSGLNSSSFTSENNGYGLKDGLKVSLFKTDVYRMTVVGFNSDAQAVNLKVSMMYLI